MKIFIKSSIAMLVIMALAINPVAVSANQKGTNRLIEVEGHIFKVVTDNQQISSVTCTEDGITYNVVMNKMTRDVAIQKVSNKILSNKVIEDYSVAIHTIDENAIDYTVRDKIKNTSSRKYDDIRSLQRNQRNENDGKMYSQIAIDLGIALIILLIAVLAVTVVYTYENIDYSWFSDVISAIKKQVNENKRYYYYACIYDKSLVIGNAFTSYAEALLYAKSILNSRVYGVYCTGSGYAYGLACSAGSYYGTTKSEIHGAQPDYQNHYHPMKTSTEKYNEHIWY